MKKTRNFYLKRVFLITTVLWLTMINEALLLNLKQHSNVLQEKTADIKIEKTKDEIVKDEKSVTVTQCEKIDQEVRKIRVLLMDNDYEGYYHSAVTVQYDGKEETYTMESELLQKSSVVIECDGEGIVITTLNRQQGNPKYQGTIEIQKTEEGLLLINELPVETYLEAVVPSEMPVSYAEEALKAQAVCARTYAYKQMSKGNLADYGADVDDSVNYQVYGNQAQNERTNKAVRETEGQVIYQGEELIEAYYFSTSAGMTSTDEIWGVKEASSYLKSVDCIYDSEQIWSKWNVEIPWDYLESRVCFGFGKPVELLNMEINKKSQCGAVIGMTAITDQGTYEVGGEYAVRELLSPEGLEIVGNDGKEYTGGKLLPSAYFQMELKKGESIYLDGKGYGHGVGMSQNAANEMAKLGYDWKYILKYFYKDIELREYEGS